MKTPLIFVAGAGALLLSSCGLFQETSSPFGSNFDPLLSPGASSADEEAVVVAEKYQPGEWVETATPYVGFYKSIPKSGARAAKTLSVATPMKVVSTEETYLRVELDSGEIGYVPQINVMARKTEEPPAAVPDYGPIPPPVDPALANPGVPPSPVGDGVSPTTVPGQNPVPRIPGVPVAPVPVPAEPNAPAPRPAPAPVPAPVPVPDSPTLPPSVPGITDQ